MGLDKEMIKSHSVFKYLHYYSYLRTVLLGIYLLDF